VKISKFAATAAAEQAHTPQVTSADSRTTGWETSFDFPSSRPLDTSFTNPYAPPVMVIEESTSRGVTEAGVDILVQYAKSCIDGATDTATSKFVASFLCCQGAVVAITWQVYSDVVLGAHSLAEYPQLVFFAAALGLLLLCSATESGIVLAHRAYCWWSSHDEQRNQR
jgi:hypothetical protein